MRSRKRGQAIVEFGVVALLFTSLLFAVIDFGLLLNTWLSVSSASREIARSASVGKRAAFLKDEANHLNIPAVSTRGFSGLCCSPAAGSDPGSAIEVRVEYFDGSCVPSPSSCTPFVPGVILNGYPAPDVDHPGTVCSSGCRPQADDLVRVTLIAHGAQVITPLIRPFFGCTNGTNPECNVALSSTTLMRFEGQEF
jgi:hypothetical protein